jgi:hypothetical protein
MFLIVGTKFISWGSEPTMQPMRCSQCGAVASFRRKKGMQFITLFFVIPIIPISGKKELVECPTCGARFEMH